MLIFSCILILVGCQSRTEDYDSASIRSPEPSLVEADKRRRSRSTERGRGSDSPYTSNVSCYSKDRVRAVIEAKRVHCTQPYGFACQPLRGLVTSRKRRVINYFMTDGQLKKLAAVSPSTDDTASCARV